MTRFLLIFCLLTLTPTAPAQDVGDELLPPEEAFSMSASLRDADTIVATWKIADGYYMYRDKLEFRIPVSGYAFGELEIPPGKVKHDEFFGDVETYRHELSAILPIVREAGAPETFTLQTRSQGCADIGVCYPPLDQVATLTLPPPGGEVASVSAGAAPTQDPSPAAESGSAETVNPLRALTSTLGGASAGDEEFLPPDEAFRFTATTGDGNRAIARWEIADGYYLYRDKFRFAADPADTVSLGAATLPNGEILHDEFFGDVEILTGDVVVEIPYTLTAGAADGFELEAEYQGCAKDGICYPPISRVAELTPTSGAKATVTATTTGAKTAPAAVAQATASPSSGGTASEKFQSEQDRIAGTLMSGGAWLTMLTFFGFGLLLTFTPCVFPMIPILSGIIVGQGTEITARKAFILSLVYVLAMALTYTIAGVLVGLSGENVQAWFQNPWVLSIFAAIFVLLSLSMFGFYELQMPSGIQSRLTSISNSQQSGTLVGVAIMGFLSALIVGPCVTAPLIGALIYIADTGDAVMGGLALFALSMGMGAPLLLIGTSAGKLLPKAGPWMDTTKAVFGVLLLGVAIWLLERFLPIQVIMLLSAALLIISAIYMGALETVREGASGWHRLWKGMGLVMLIYGATLMVGAVSGGSSLLQPLRGVMASGPAGVETAGHELDFERIETVADLDAVLARAKDEGKSVMLDFYADWCVSCKEMEAFTFSDAAVQAALSDTILVQADVTANRAEDKALLKHFGLFGPPAILFFGPDGSEVRSYRVVGFMSADNFATHVEDALNGPERSS
ncbi:MAG: protein-disulfide reductase DsbD [Gammaproteobacteria bacterium]|jgi:thiol:disulfide interchange protein DsbD|nr:protein-disulfide reductase DsbD [Gammaproteobacteria bacterium]